MTGEFSLVVHNDRLFRYILGYNSEINPTFQDLQYEPKINNGSLSYTFENLQPATRHRLRVITEANQQQSGAVETNSATLPNDPLNLQVKKTFWSDRSQPSQNPAII